MSQSHWAILVGDPVELCANLLDYANRRMLPRLKRLVEFSTSEPSIAHPMPLSRFEALKAHTNWFTNPIFTHSAREVSSVEFASPRFKLQVLESARDELRRWKSSMQTATHLKGQAAEIKPTKDGLDGRGAASLQAAFRFERLGKDKLPAFPIKIDGVVIHLGSLNLRQAYVPARELEQMAGQLPTIGEHFQATVERLKSPRFISSKPLKSSARPVEFQLKAQSEVASLIALQEDGSIAMAVAEAQAGWRQEGNAGAKTVEALEQMQEDWTERHKTRLDLLESVIRPVSNPVDTLYIYAGIPSDPTTEPANDLVSTDPLYQLQLGLLHYSAIAGERKFKGAPAWWIREKAKNVDKARKKLLAPMTGRFRWKVSIAISQAVRRKL